MRTCRVANRYFVVFYFNELANATNEKTMWTRFGGRQYDWGTSTRGNDPVSGTHTQTYDTVAAAAASTIIMNDTNAWMELTPLRQKGGVKGGGNEND